MACQFEGMSWADRRSLGRCMALGYVYIQEIGRESERLGKRGWKLRICLGRHVVLLEYAGTVDRDRG